ncbi:MAG TPA: serine hydrolase [Chloroflexia bacterium]|nr:serine hydrolase [Chloroflexia bacterium]
MRSLYCSRNAGKRHIRRRPPAAGPRRTLPILAVLLLWAVVLLPLLPAARPAPARPAPAAPPPAQIPTVPLLYSSAPDYPDAGLQDILDDAVDGADGSWAVSVKKLDSGQYAAVNAHIPAVTASLYKVFVMYEVMHQRALGNLSLDDTALITDGNAAEDVTIGDLRWEIGSRVKLETLLNQMITVSDNTAASTLAGLVGLDTINASLQRLGLANSQLNFGSGDNLTTAAEYTHLLEKIATSQVLDRASCQYMINLLLQQQLNDQLPVGLPDGTPIAHKTGTLDSLQHDAGIVYGPSGPYVITVMSWNLTDYDTSTAIMRKLSANVYNYFNSREFKPARYFPATRQVVGPAFLLYYSANGGQATFGLPLAPESRQGDHIVQYFERARLERPAGGGAVTLGAIGRELVAAQGRHFDPVKPTDPNDPNTVWFPATGQAISQPFLTYWREHGGPAIFGLPISNLGIEQVGGQSFRVQYFERARFELHGTQIQLGLVGKELFTIAR